MIELELVADRDRIRTIWRELERATAPAYFATWGWVECWLDSLPSPPALAVLHDRGAAIAAGFLARRRRFHHHLVPTRTWFLNSTGVTRYDELTVEHNGLLHVRPLPLAALVDALPAGWDEVVLPAIDGDAFAALDGGRDWSVHVEREVALPWVDLAQVRARGHLALLHAGTRAQLRRAQRAAGEIEVEAAADLGRALEIYGELVDLHTAGWDARGVRTALSDPWFDGFHRRLIARRFDHGEIQLLRITGGGRRLGCLYNLVSSGRVLFYQSGFIRDDDPHLKPGYLCHAAAIEHDARAGHRVYDFLGGDARYKQSLATHSDRLLWLRVQRRTARSLIEDRLRTWYRTLGH